MEIAKFEIERNFERELKEMQEARMERIIMRAIGAQIITAKGGIELLKEVWQ